MKRIKNRAYAALLLALLLIGGVAALLVRIWKNGGGWAAYGANSSAYTSLGVLNCGTLTDRNGLVLAHAGDGVYWYADDAAVRTACLHVVGDYRGYIGTGALTAFADRLTGYSRVFGTTRGGATVSLSVDAALQTAAYGALAGRSGAVLLMNYETGEILCMVSSPAYDPNGEADESVDGVYLNRCISAAYAPGSVFKLVTLTAALENIDDLYDRTFTCAGSVTVGGETVVCTGVHGEQTIEQALANSCNCAFAEISLELGAETLARYAGELGFTSRLSLDGIATAAGQFEQAPAGSGSLAWSGIGQYTDLVCPYAMLRLVAAVAAGGTVREPTLLLGGDNGGTKLLEPAVAEAMGEMMNYDVSYEYSGQVDFSGLDLCAKTGTAEVGDGSTHAWFTGYLKSGAPLAFVVVVERGGGGLAAAGPVARTVLLQALESYSDD